MRPAEAAPWLALYDEARAAIDDPVWAAAVPAPRDTPPFIDGTTLTIDPGAAARLVRAVVDHAAIGEDVAVALLAAAIAEDEAHLAVPGVAPGIVAAAAALATMPLLQACRSAWAARIPGTWIDAACPICGAWAALVEARGLERSLRHRCARCGADWAAEPVRCGFCGIRDHARLVSLVSEQALERGRVEACGVCRGYLKTITTLTAAPPADVALLDLETVHLDVAALEHSFHRPPPAPRRVALG